MIMHFCLSDNSTGKSSMNGAKRSVSKMVPVFCAIMERRSSPMPVSTPGVCILSSFLPDAPLNSSSREPGKKNSLNTMFQISTSFPRPFLQYISVVGPQGPSLPVGPQKLSARPCLLTVILESTDFQIFSDSSSAGTIPSPAKTET